MHSQLSQQGARRVDALARRPPSLRLMPATPLRGLRTTRTPTPTPTLRRRRAPTAAVAARANNNANADSSEQPWPQAPIDPTLASEYWGRRPVAVAARAAEVAWAFFLWLAGCARRRAAAALLPPSSSPSPGRLERADARALRQTVASLSPAYIKIAQALAARPDLLPPSYVRELELLQDRLPAFSSEEALALLQSELAPAIARLGGGVGGRGDIGAIFGAITPEPVAAASLGQVYRASLRRDVAEKAGFVRWGGDTAPAAAATDNDADYASGPLDRETTMTARADAEYVPVAVKVQRPDVAERVSLDCLLLRTAAGVARRAGRLNTDLPSLVDAWSRSLSRELDYEQEARNAWRLGKGLSAAMSGGGVGGGGDGRGRRPAVVRVPRAFSGGLTTRRVLTMEWLEGRRLRSAGRARRSGSGAYDDEEGEGPASAVAATTTTTADAAERRRDLRLVEVGVRCFLEQILGGVGFYNADPHAGNLLVLEPSSSSSSSLSPQPPPPVVLGILDAGMCAEVSESQRVALLRAALHLAAGEYAALAEDLVALDMLPPPSSSSSGGAGENDDSGSLSEDGRFAAASKQQVVAALEDVFRAQLRQPTPLASSSSSASSIPALAAFSSDDEGGRRPPAARQQDDDNSGATFGGLGAKLGRTMYKFRFRLPQTFTLLVRALSVLEGLALSADPDYRVVSAAIPWVARRVLLEQSPELQAALRRLLYVRRRPVGAEQAVARARAGRGQNRRQQEEEDPEEEAFDFARLEALLRQAARVPAGADPTKTSTKSRSGAGGADAYSADDESALALLLSPDASFVRGLLEDEVAKGLDAAWRLGADRALLALPLLPAAVAPGFSTPGDSAQLEGLSRLASAVGALAAGGGGREGGEREVGSGCGAPLLAARAKAASDALAWLAKEARALPSEARGEALRIPLRVAQKLSSRVAARAIRATLL